MVDGSEDCVHYDETVPTEHWQTELYPSNLGKGNFMVESLEEDKLDLHSEQPATTWGTRSECEILFSFFIHPFNWCHTALSHRAVNMITFSMHCFTQVFTWF